VAWPVSAQACVTDRSQLVSFAISTAYGRVAGLDSSNVGSNTGTMRVTIEPPEGWGPARLLLVKLQRLGYDIEEHIILGKHLFVVGSQPPAAGRPATCKP
jgi:hypothetical protein